MVGRALLDTNIVIALFADEESVKQHLANVSGVFVPSIVLGELYYGARQSARSEQNIARIDEFAVNNRILLCDTTTARQYGAIKNQLRTKGKPMPENDIWIAAIAEQHQLILVTWDRHFQNVARLTIERW